MSRTLTIPIPIERAVGIDDGAKCGFVVQFRDEQQIFGAGVFFQQAQKGRADCGFLATAAVLYQGVGFAIVVMDELLGHGFSSKKRKMFESSLQKMQAPQPFYLSQDRKVLVVNHRHHPPAQRGLPPLSQSCIYRSVDAGGRG